MAPFALPAIDAHIDPARFGESPEPAEKFVPVHWSDYRSFSPVWHRGPPRPILTLMLTPLLVAERPNSDVGRPFGLSSEFHPAGDQPQAIDELCEGLARGEKDQVLLGVTGSGKTFTMAHVIQRLQRPAIVLAPNKTLAAQLYGEM